VIERDSSESSAIADSMPAPKTVANSDEENNNVVNDDIKQKLLPSDDKDEMKKVKKKEVDEKLVTPHKKKVRLLSLAILGLAELLGGCTLSILAPFYSAEAEVHGLGATEAGVVFASIFVVQIIFVPVFGKLIGRIGSCRLFICGVLLAGTTTAAFGFLPAIRQGPAFLAASLALRSVTAVGEAAMNTAVLPLARRRGGPGRECSVLSWMETMNGMGTTFGPFIGGVLYESGGFCLPFVVSGGLLVFCGLAAAVVLDPEEELVTTSPATLLLISLTRTLSLLFLSLSSSFFSPPHSLPPIFRFILLSQLLLFRP